MKKMEATFFEPFKGRSIKFGERVDVYRNLNTENGYSIRCANSGLVLAHCSTVSLSDCIFRVSEAGRQKTIQEKRRRVHAYVRGKLEAVNTTCDPGMVSVYYNPYHTALFTRKDNDQAVTSSDKVHMEGRFCYIPSNSQSIVAAIQLF